MTEPPDIRPDDEVPGDERAATAEEEDHSDPEAFRGPPADPPYEEEKA